MNSALKTGSEYEFSNICCCCLKSDCFKDISSEYEFSGHKEVYGDMLNETFHLQVPKHFPEDYIVQLICDHCIVQLREAYAFRSRMLDSQAVILQRWDQFQSRRSEATTQETDSTLVTEIKLEVEPEAGCDDGETGADIYQEVDEILQNIKMELVENSEKVTRKRKGNGRRAKQKKCKIEDESEDEVELPTDKVNTTINCPTEEAPHCLPENEVTVDIMPGVNYPVTSGSKEAKKTELKAVNCQSECITNKQYAIQQSHMIQIVSDLANQMAEINRKLDLPLARSEETFSPTDDNAGLSELLMSFLSGIGGRNVRSLTTNMLRRIILDDVAELYSLTGKQMKNSNKKSFMSTETYKLIFQICRKINEDVTEDSLKEIISDWLNQAKVRLSKRIMGKDDKEDSGFGFKDKAKAEETLRLLEEHPLNYRRLTVRGLLGRAKRVLSMTKAEDKIKNIKEAMQVFENWLEELDKNKEQKTDKKPEKKEVPKKKEKEDKNGDDQDSSSDSDVEMEEKAKKPELPPDTVPGLGFKDKETADGTLKELEGRDPDYQKLAVKGLIGRAKRVLTCTRDETKLSNIKEAISIFEKFLDDFDSMHLSKQNNPYLSLGIVKTAAKLAENVSEQQQSFIAAYSSVNGEYKRLRTVAAADGEKTWDIVRNAALKELKEKHAEAKLFNDKDEPTTEHLEMMLWAYSPEAAKVKKYVPETKEDKKEDTENKTEDRKRRSSARNEDDSASKKKKD